MAATRTSGDPVHQRHFREARQGRVRVRVACWALLSGLLACSACAGGRQANLASKTGDGAAQRTAASSAPAGQTEDEDAAPGVLEGRLGEVIVTAQRRTENVQNVPIAIQVVQGERLATQNYNALQSLTQTLPGVHIATGQVTDDLYIRGIGSGENPGFEQSVGVFVDDMYFGRSRMSEATFLDLDRIEVLKGPQSTYFGNNAIAGALNIITKKPGRTFDAWARALYGMFGQYALEGAVGGPITHGLGARVAVTENGQERGWLTNTANGERMPRDNNVAGRLTLSYQPFDSLSAVLKIESSRHRTLGAASDQPLQWTNCPPPAPFSLASPDRFCPNALAAEIPMGLSSNDVAYLPGERNSLSSVVDELTLEYRSWGQTFTAVSGYYNFHYLQDYDKSGLPALVETNQFLEGYHQFSQELRVASPRRARVEYLAGLYYQTDYDYENYNIVAPFLNASVLKLNPFLSPYLSSPGTSFAAAPDFEQSESAYSAFGSLSWHVTGRLSLNAGLRASWVKKDFLGLLEYATSTQSYGGLVPLPPAIQPRVYPFLGTAGSLPLTLSNRALMPSTGIQYHLGRSAMLYFTFARGFKAGGFDGEDTIDQYKTGISYGPEHVNSYEVGIKSKWLSDTVLVNFDLFRGDYSDLQVGATVYHPATNTYSAVISNAAKSRSEGAELEAAWDPTARLRLRTNVTYLKSRYLDYTTAAPTNLQNFCAGLSLAQYQATPLCGRFAYPVKNNAYNLSGFPTQFAPKWSGSVAASYRIPLGARVELVTELSPYFTTSYNPDPDGLFPSVGGYVRLDGRVSCESTDGAWAVDLIGKNLTDRIIVTNYVPDQATREPPRSVAAQFRYRW
jgi:iron complex outermembrane receptor protein